jgi:diguanylate cyclase (GGDEF)-like protein
MRRARDGRGQRYAALLGVRSFLLFAVLVPTVGMLLVGVSATTEVVDRREVAVRVQDDADAVVAIVDARLVLADEFTESAIVSVATDLGVAREALDEIYGVDFTARLAASRAAVDSDAVFASLPELADDRARLDALRVEVDAGTVTFAGVRAVLGTVTETLDTAATAHLAEVHEHLAAKDLSGTLLIRAETVAESFEILRSGNLRVAMAIDLVRSEPTPELLAGLLDATTRQRLTVERLGDGLGPRVRTAWVRHAADPVVQRFETVLDEIAVTYLAGATSPLAEDWTAFGDAFFDGDRYAAGLSAVVEGAADDLRAEAASQERAATTELDHHIRTGALLAVVSVASAVLLGRAVSRPIRRLEAAAHDVHHGRFDLEPIRATGPRELVDTATAFNDMASTLAAVESHAMALADDPDASLLDTVLPGRTGAALQQALDRVRTSMRESEQHRLELEYAATHDGLTGLVNRSAALAMLQRDLSLGARTDREVMALFIDVDGLKAINDEYGHAAGDEAIRTMAEVLRSCTRASDVVARLGGDEYLVAGFVDDRREVERLADRILAAVAESHIATPAGSVVLQCSIGMTVRPAATTSMDDLIQAADAALYLAKRQGRGRATWEAGTLAH